MASGGGKMLYWGMSSVLAKQDILELLKREPPLVSGLLSAEEQVQPNGFDLTLAEIAMMESGGTMAASNAGRRLPALSPLVFDGLGFVDLMPGIYTITYNETVNLPRDVMALARPRSSLLRCGVGVGTAVWDAGYCGRSQSLLIVYNPCGFRLQRNTRVVQLVFWRLSDETEGYCGVYQHENLA